jgi:hypothetical protein
MKKNIFSLASVLSLCAFLFLFSACGGTSTSQTSETDSLTNQSVETETNDEVKKITYEILTETEQGDASQAKSQVQLLVITEVPAGSDLATLQSILQKQQKYTGDAKEFLAEIKQNYINSKTSEEGIEEENWYTETRVEVIYNDNYITTIELFKEEYAGGAHGENEDLYCVLDLKNNRKMTLDMLFDTQGLTVLKQKLTDEALKLAKTEGYTTLEGLGYFSEEVTPTENFGVSEKGITFGYQKGELAPFMVPGVSFTVAWSELKDIIKSDSPVTFFVK